MRYTREDLKALQAATLDEKIDHSLSMIEIFYLVFGRQGQHGFKIPH